MDVLRRSMLINIGYLLRTKFEYFAGLNSRIFPTLDLGGCPKFIHHRCIIQVLYSIAAGLALPRLVTIVIVQTTNLKVIVIASCSISSIETITQTWIHPLDLIRGSYRPSHGLLMDYW